MTKVALEQVIVAPGRPDQNRDMAARRANTAFESGAEVVVLPELVIGGYIVDPDVAAAVAEPLDGPSTECFRRIAAANGGLIAYGLCERASDELFNTVLMVGADGPVLHYRKLHLFDQERRAFSPGDLGLPVADTPFGVIGVCICYDLRFVEVLRILSLQGADLVLAPAAWVGGFDKSVPTVGATRHVDSVLAQANLDQVAVVAVSQVAGGDRLSPPTLGGSVACDAYGELLAGPLSRTEAGSAIADIDIDAVRAAHVRSPAIQPRNDRRRDVYAVTYGGASL
jgi:predicted amidohydrolase